MIATFLLVILAAMLIYPYTPIVKLGVPGLALFLGVLFSLGSSTAISGRHRAHVHPRVPHGRPRPRR